MNRPGFTGGLISSEDGPHSRTRGPVPSGTEGDLGRGGPDVYDARVQAEDLEHKPGKRVFDLAIVALSMPFWLPLLGAVALAIKVSNPGAPVLYLQLRTGRGGRRFRMYKFRTMIPDADAASVCSSFERWCAMLPR